MNGFHVMSSRWVDRPVALLSEVTGGKLERSLRYREHTGPLGLHYELRGACSVGKKRWGGLDLTRERGRFDFDDREVALLRRLTPHLGAALRAATLLSQVSPKLKRTVSQEYWSSTIADGQFPTTTRWPNTYSEN